MNQLSVENCCAASKLHSFPIPWQAGREGRVINILDSEEFERSVHDVD